MVSSNESSSFSAARRQSFILTRKISKKSMIDPTEVSISSDSLTTLSAVSIFSDELMTE